MVLFKQEEKDDNLVSAIDGIKDDELSNLENGNDNTEPVAENDVVNHQSTIESNISDAHIGDKQEGDEINEELCENATDNDCPGIYWETLKVAKSTMQIEMN